MAERSAMDDDFEEEQDLGPDGEVADLDYDDTSTEEEFVPAELVEDPTDALTGEKSSGSTAEGEVTTATTRTKNPSYHVFRASGNSSTELWEKLTQDEKPIRASSRRKAIVIASAGSPGECFAVPAKEVNPINYLGSEQTTIDRFE